MNLTVVGLGAKCGDVTINGQSAILSADLVLVRTNQSAASTILHKLRLKEDNIESFDEFYELADDFDHLNELITHRITQLAEEYDNIVYCVDGDGVSDSSVEMLTKRFSLTVIPGTSEAAYRVPSACAVSVTATALIAGNICIDTLLPLVVTQIDNPLVAGNVKLCLLNSYAFDTECALTVGHKKVQLALEDIDRQKKYAYSTTLYIGAQNICSKTKYCMGDLLRSLTALPNNGGEWTARGCKCSDSSENSCKCGDSSENSSMNYEDIGEKLENNLLSALLDIDSAVRSGEVEFCDIVSGVGARLSASQHQVAQQEAAKVKEKGEQR